MLLNSILLQSDSLLLSDEAIIISDVNDISVLQLFLQGGLAGQVIIMILFILSIITMYLFFERLVSIKKALKKEDYFFNSIRFFT